MTLISLNFASSEAIPLAHAMVQHVATELQVRVLFVKGLTLQAQRLRKERPVADVDVILDPAKFAQLEQALAKSGWYRRPSAALSFGPEHHAISLINDTWPVDIDLHKWMPGMQFAGPETCFDLLWEHRVKVTVAHFAVDTPCPAHSLMIGVAHCLREHGSPEKRAELAQHLTAFNEVLSASERQLLITHAEELSAVYALRPWLELALTPRENARLRDRSTPSQREEWRLATDAPAKLWSTFKKSKGVRAKFEVLQWVFWPTREQLALMPHVSAYDLETLGTHRVRLRRLKGALARRKFRQQRISVTSGPSRATPH